MLFRANGKSKAHLKKKKQKCYFDENKGTFRHVWKG